MDTLLVFTDGSVDSVSKVGYGAYIVVYELKAPQEPIKSNIKLKRFENTSSSKLELQTLLWALDDIFKPGIKVTVYTDSQNIIGLPGRRDRIEKNDFRTKSTKLRTNHEQYKELFRMIDRIDCNFMKVKGHQKSIQKNEIDKLFTLVDRASRNALRNEQKEL